jgi:flagellar basal-body rod protein FlgB
MMKLQPFAPHVEALKLRELRHRVLSSNIANADTPHYKARDIDFAAALKSAQTDAFGLRRTSERHLAGFAPGNGVTPAYRIPTQPSLDGNTVETDVEQAAFAENAVRYRASLTFLDGAIRTLRYAIKGGD